MDKVVVPSYARPRVEGRYKGTAAFRLTKHGLPVVYTRKWDKKRLRQELLFCREITPSGCWEWKGTRHDFGYGLIRVDGKRYNVATVSLWAFKNDDGPRFGGKKIQALHRCDNPACYRPSHLFSGSQKENMHDMHRKKRSWGERRTHCSKGHPLTPDNVYHIKRNKNTRICKKCCRAYQRQYVKDHPALKRCRWNKLAETIKFRTDNPSPLTPRRRKVLMDLLACCNCKPPMSKITCESLGGSDSSHHYDTLSKMVLESLVGRKKLNCRCSKGGDVMFGHSCKTPYTYWITDRGRKFLKDSGL